jgi:hypothetical protein
MNGAFWPRICLIIVVLAIEIVNLVIGGVVLTVETMLVQLRLIPGIRLTIYGRITLASL